MKERLINFPKIEDTRGNLSVVEQQKEVPFDIARTYWIYDVPGGAERGSHAFYKQEECLIALSGSFDVVLYDGKKERRYTLNRAYYGLYIPPMTWRRLENFSTNSFCLVLSSDPYTSVDYIEDFKHFCHLKNEERRNS